MNKKTKKMIIIAAAIVVVLVIWGLIGAQQAAKITNDCTFGIGNGNSICWIWEKNTIGKIADIFVK